MLFYLNAIVDYCHTVNRIHQFNLTGEYVYVGY
jgi:hypothetical protein